MMRNQNAKQNVFDDFIAAAEYLMRKIYFLWFPCCSRWLKWRFACRAAMTQRPELMKVALPAVGVMDMLRYHTFTSGGGWAYDYGTAQDSQAMLNTSKLFSGTQCQSGHTISSDYGNNGRSWQVVPAHSFKFAAELQEKRNNPTLIRIDVKAGHGLENQFRLPFRKTWIFKPSHCTIWDLKHCQKQMDLCWIHFSI
jgi:prolyl oligopeptidase